VAPQRECRLAAIDQVTTTLTGRSPYVQTSNDVPVVIEIVDFATGRKSPFKTITPADATGLLSLGPSTMSPDGRQYAFGFSKRISALFVVSHGK